MSFENVSFGSKMIPRIFVCFVAISVWLFYLNDKIVPYLTWSGVKSLVVVLSKFKWRLLMLA